MADVKWIKLATNIFDNRKIKQIETLPDGDSIIVIWVKLLCLAGTTNDCGCIYLTKEIPYTDQMLASQFNRPLTTVQLALQTFEQFGMIEVVDNILMISNWEKYQSVEKLERLKEQRKEINARYYQKKKALELENKTSYKISDKTRQDITDIDKELDIEVDKENNNKTKRFKKPSVEEIETYCNERNNNINPNAFYDYYESKDWMIGKNRMKDWKAAIRTWERNTGGKNEKKGINITKFDV